MYRATMRVCLYIALGALPRVRRVLRTTIPWLNGQKFYPRAGGWGQIVSSKNFQSDLLMKARRASSCACGLWVPGVGTGHMSDGDEWSDDGESPRPVDMRALAMRLAGSGRPTQPQRQVKAVGGSSEGLDRFVAARAAVQMASLAAVAVSL